MTVNMKRRNADCGKLRRPAKRNKITEGIYGSTFLYLKFLLVWFLVMMADFILEFRFEYLWPFWLMMRSVYDSFKYQGLAFSVFFVCIAVTSDMVCYLFIPVQWLFFAASTYVWVQYVWHTERGICLPTVSLWLLFVYIEAAIRLREFRTFPFHLDLCRPFAAHCIGYPVVTLGFGFKSYISYKMRLRKQKDVQKENNFFIQLLNSALPVEQQQQQQQKEQTIVNPEKTKALPSKSQEDVISNGHTSAGHKRTSSKTSDSTTEANKKQQQIEDYEFIEQTPKRANINDFDENADNYVNDQNVKNSKTSSMNKTSASSKLNTQKDNVTKEKKGKSTNSKDSSPLTDPSSRGDISSRLENDVKRLKADLQSSRNNEQELRSQIHALKAGDKLLTGEVYQLRQDNENLQNKLHNLVTCRQQDKQSLLNTERKLQEERKLRTAAETQLATERKTKKVEEAAAARAVAMAAVTRVDCSENCKARRKDLEIDIQKVGIDLALREDQIRQLEMEARSLRQYKEAQNETEVLMSALAAMQDKNQHLENSLSAETRVKLELFSALGDAKRQLEIQQGLLNQKNKEIAELKSKVAEAMALMPSTSSYPSQLTQMPPLLSSPKYCNGHMSSMESKLNPNAIDYTPKSQS